MWFKHLYLRVIYKSQLIFSLFPFSERHLQLKKKEDGKSPVLIPRLDLQLSTGYQKFNDLNETQSNFNHIENKKPENKEIGQEPERMMVMSCFNDKKNHQHCILDIEELIVKLEQTLSKKNKSSLKKIQDECLAEFGLKNQVIWYENPQVVLINHLRLLHSLSVGNDDEDATKNRSETQGKESCPRRESKYCVKKKIKKFSKKELLKISLVSMNNYNALVEENTDIVDKIRAELKKEKEGIKGLKDKIKELELIIEDMKRVRIEDEARFEVKLRGERTKREYYEKKCQKELENMKIGMGEDQPGFEVKSRDDRTKIEDSEKKYEKEIVNLKIEKEQYQIRFEVKLKDENKKLTYSEKKCQTGPENVNIGQEEDQVSFEDELWSYRANGDGREKNCQEELENIKMIKKEKQARLEQKLREEFIKRKYNETKYQKGLENRNIEREEDKVKVKEEIENMKKIRNEIGQVNQYESEEISNKIDEKVGGRKEPVRYKEKLERTKKLRNGMGKGHQNELEKMKRKEEVVRVVDETRRRCAQLFQQMKMNLKTFENGKTAEIEKLQKCLVEKDAENDKLRAEISEINESLNKIANENEAFIAKIEEELKEKDKLISKLTANFEEEFLWESDLMHLLTEVEDIFK